MSDLIRKLYRLGVTKGTQELKSPSRQDGTLSRGQDGTLSRGQDGTLSPGQDSALPAGEQVKTPWGVCFYIEERYPLDHSHGDAPLSILLDHDPVAAAHMAADPQPARFDLRRALFIDTETTGLGRGTGVLAFLIGVGYFTDDAFVLRQYFLRDPAEEPAALQHLADWSEDFAGLVSFNGRGFDVPVLQNRFILARLRPAILKAPHLDLLPPARRVWRGHFESCRLGTLERQVLGVQRAQADVMSWLIPDLYRQYLRGGDNGEMRQVLYHNAVDVLSLVVLAERLCRLFADPLSEAVSPRERAALARWYQALDMPTRAEDTYRAALAQVLPLDTQHDSLKHLAAMLKRQDRRAEAVPLWIQWAMEDEGQVEAHVELAKFYEWHQVDLEKALAWTQQALAVVARWPAGHRRRETQDALTHRRARLEKKIRKASD